MQCDYEWIHYDFELFYPDGGPVLDLELFTSANLDARQITFISPSYLERLVLTARLTAHLSDDHSIVSSELTATFYRKILPQVTNTAPYFLIEVQDEYSRIKSLNATSQLDSVVLGKVYDD